MKIEEAALTGESVPVSKFTEPLAGEQVSLGDRKNMAYMGSAVVYGRGRMVVTATGMDTEMGKIAGVLAQTEQEETPLQRKLTQLGSTLSKMVLAICVFIFVFDLLVAGSLTLESVLETFMVAVSLAVAAIPEGLATVVTVVLSIGVTKMSQHNAVIRRLTAVETLGCTQVICSDKTGTLTQNKMTVVEHTGPEGLLGTAMTLCNDAVENPDGTVQGEPTEAALVRFGVDSGLDKNRLEQEQPRAAEAPFDSSRKMMSTIHRMDNGFIQYTKGAPDEVLRRCTRYEESGQMLPMTEEKRQEILKDPHIGAFGVMRLCGYLLVSFVLWATLPDYAGVPIWLSFVLSRCLSGLAVATFPLARGSGLAYTFAAAADKKRVARRLCVASVLLVLALCWFRLRGMGMALVALGIFVHYRRKSEREFGGLSGDLAGWFLQRAEIWMLGALAAVQLLEGMKWFS